VYHNLQEQIQNDPTFFSKVITGYETWVYRYDMETKQQSSQWKSPSSPHPKKVKKVCLNVKSMLIVFFILTQSFTMNMSHRVQMLTNTSTEVSYSVYQRLLGSSIQENGLLVIDYCIMALLLLTPPFPYNIWPRTTWLWPPTPCTLQIWLPVISFSTRHYEAGVPEVFPAIAELLDKVHYLASGLL
jgi:hypothetical protein